MDALTQLDTILALFEKFSVEVRREYLGGAGGGLCRIRGVPVLFLDLDTDSATQLDRGIEALVNLPDIDLVFLPPILRERVEVRRNSR